ncbi:MAG: hypothetical protein IKZ43_06040 [Acidaminococcaceae bacterium]|nr:hypothetical protein [Acidaminococcaceae bacterium]
MANGIRADLISANFMLAIVILVFVGFFCIRMLSNTKTACILTVTIFICVLLYLQIRFEIILPVIKAIINSIQRIVGVACCVLSAIAVVKGLADEEKSEQYVHRRAYWCACIVLLYFGLFLIGAGMNR